MEQIKKCIDFFKHPKIIETVSSSHWELITCMDYEVLEELIPHFSVSISQKRDCKGFSLAHIGYHIPSNTFAYLVENMDDSCLGFQDDYGQNPLMGLVDTLFEGEQDEETLDKVKVLCSKMQPEYFHQRNKSNLSVLDESFICTIEQMIGQASTNSKNEEALSEKVFRYLINTVPTTLFFSLDNDNKRTIEKVIAETQLPACKDFGVLMIDRLQNQDFDILTASGQSLLQLAIYSKNGVCAEAMIKKMNLQQLNFVDKDNKSAHDIATEQNSSHLKECIESQINTLRREPPKTNEIMCVYDSGKHHKKREFFKKEVLDVWSWIKKPSNKEVSYDESDDGKGNRDGESQGLIKDTEKNIKSGKR